MIPRYFLSFVLLLLRDPSQQKLHAVHEIENALDSNIFNGSIRSVKQQRWTSIKKNLTSQVKSVSKCQINKKKGISSDSSYRWQARWAGGGWAPLCGLGMSPLSWPRSWGWTWSPRHLRSSLAPHPPYTWSSDLHGKRRDEAQAGLNAFGGIFLFPVLGSRPPTLVKLSEVTAYPWTAAKSLVYIQNTNLIVISMTVTVTVTILHNKSVREQTLSFLNSHRCMSYWEC